MNEDEYYQEIDNMIYNEYYYCKYYYYRRDETKPIYEVLVLEN